MLEMTVQYGNEQYYPVYRRLGVQQWRYMLVDGVIQCFPDRKQAQDFLEALRAEMMAQRQVCRVLVAHS